MDNANLHGDQRPQTHPPCPHMDMDGLSGRVCGGRGLGGAVLGGASQVVSTLEVCGGGVRGSRHCPPNPWRDQRHQTPPNGPPSPVGTRAPSPIPNLFLGSPYTLPPHTETAPEELERWRVKTLHLIYTQSNSRYHKGCWRENFQEPLWVCCLTACQK